MVLTGGTKSSTRDHFIARLSYRLRTRGISEIQRLLKIHKIQRVAEDRVAASRGWHDGLHFCRPAGGDRCLTCPPPSSPIPSAPDPCPCLSSPGRRASFRRPCPCPCLLAMPCRHLPPSA